LVRVKNKRPRGITEEIRQILPWQLVRAKGHESARWEAYDGRWVTVTVGHGDALGTAVVEHSDGRREHAPDYETAMTLAKSWRD
jgi:hypothetical protein